MRHLQIYRYIADVARLGSVRKAAERAHLTPSALTRKIQDFEEELGTPVFERLPQGMRLNAAGELLLRHIRDQNAGLERLRTDLSDLAGVRRGHVSLACSQAFLDNLVPDEIAAYRQEFPHVTFSVNVRDNQRGVSALEAYEADLALLINPPRATGLHELLIQTLPLCAVVSRSHPLAKATPVRLRDCCRHSLAVPSANLAIGVLLNDALNRHGLSSNVAVQSDSLEFLRAFVLRGDAVTFQFFSRALENDTRLCARPISTQDLDPVRVSLGQLKGRSLSVAAEKFALHLRKHLSALSKRV